MKSWKTTLCGVMTLLGVTVPQFYPEHTKLGALLAALASGLGLLFARDNNVTSEQAGAGKAESNGKLPLIRILCGGLCHTWLLAGCVSHPQGRAYQSLETVMTLVDRAEKAYGRECALGKVSTKDQTRVDQRIREFHAAFQVAVEAAAADYTAQPGPDLTRLAESLVKLIYTFAKEPAP